MNENLKTIKYYILLCLIALGTVTVAAYIIQYYTVIQVKNKSKELVDYSLPIIQKSVDFQNCLNSGFINWIQFSQSNNPQLIENFNKLWSQGNNILNEIKSDVNNYKDEVSAKTVEQIFEQIKKSEEAQQIVKQKSENLIKSAAQIQQAAGEFHQKLEELSNKYSQQYQGAINNLASFPKNRDANVRIVKLNGQIAKLVSNLRINYLKIGDQNSDKQEINAQIMQDVNKLAEICPDFKSIIPINEKRNQAGRNTAQLLQDYKEFVATIPVINQKLSALAVEFSSQLNKRSIEQMMVADNQIDKVGYYILIGFIVFVVIGFFIVRYMVKHLINPIKHNVNQAVKLSKGDLSQDIKDDIQIREMHLLSNAMNDISTNLRKIIENIVVATNSINDNSNNLMKSSMYIEQLSSEQANSADFIGSSLEQITASISQNSSNAIETEKIASQSSLSIQACVQTAEKSRVSMEKIADTISVIDQIAFQTNILALNAAVEAARAGEHGKGFSVVASEVRKLAERCAVAAKEIDQVSTEGVEISRQAQEQFLELLPQIQKTATLVQEISAASSEQNTSSQAIQNTVEGFNKNTQNLASLSQELLSFCQDLKVKSDNLKELVSFFKM